MSLFKLQEEFANHIYNKNDAAIFSKLNLSGIPLHERLDVYRNNIFGSFDDALGLTYKVTKKIVGDDYFFLLTKKYREKYFSNSGNLEDYGAYFSDLIKSLKAKHKLNYLSDVAKLEWFYNLSYFSKDALGIDIKKLQNLSESDFMSLNFELHPSCYLISSKYPVYSIWQSNNNDEVEINLEEQKGQFMIIERSGLRVNIHELTRMEYEFLKMINEQKNIHQIHKILSKKQKDFDIGSFINKFISTQIINNFYVQNN